MRLPSAVDGDMRCMAIGVCPPPGVYPPPETGGPDPVSPPETGGPDPVPLPDVVGLRTRQAIERLVDAGFGARVVERDGVSLPVTMDYRPDRVNLSVADDIVVRAAWG
jgi:hypothetical protein